MFKEHSRIQEEWQIWQNWGGRFVPGRHLTSLLWERLTISWLCVFVQMCACACMCMCMCVCVCMCMCICMCVDVYGCIWMSSCKNLAVHEGVGVQKCKGRGGLVLARKEGGKEWNTENIKVNKWKISKRFWDLPCHSLRLWSLFDRLRRDRTSKIVAENPDSKSKTHCHRRPPPKKETLCRICCIERRERERERKRRESEWMCVCGRERDRKNDLTVRGIFPKCARSKHKTKAHVRPSRRSIHFPSRTLTKTPFDECIKGKNIHK